MSKRTLSVSEFKAKSLGLLERVSRTGETLIITKHGKPLAQVVPFRESSEKPEPGRLEGTLLSETDTISPFGARLWQAAEDLE